MKMSALISSNSLEDVLRDGNGARFLHCQGLLICAERQGVLDLPVRPCCAGAERSSMYRNLFCSPSRNLLFAKALHVASVPNPLCLICAVNESEGFLLPLHARGLLTQGPK